MNGVCKSYATRSDRAWLYLEVHVINSSSSLPDLLISGSFLMLLPGTPSAPMRPLCGYAPEAQRPF